MCCIAGGGGAEGWEEVLSGALRAASEWRCFMLQKGSSSLLLSLHQRAGSGVTPPGGGLNSFVGLPPAAAAAAVTEAATAAANPRSAAAQGGGGGSSFVCNVCFKAFLSGWELRRHLHAHADERPFHCPYCSQRSNFKHNLKSHIRSIHPGKPFAFTTPTSTDNSSEG